MQAAARFLGRDDGLAGNPEGEVWQTGCLTDPDRGRALASWKHKSPLSNRFMKIFLAEL
jgi:hypothetical protein